MSNTASREMTHADFDWAAELMERRRARYAEHSPVFWRPAEGVTEQHARFMRNAAAADGAVARRTEHGFVLLSRNEGRCLVDDFAVEADEQWPIEGAALLLTGWEHAWSGSRDQPVVRVVTARHDEPKRVLLMALGLAVAARWWVKELTATGEPSRLGPIKIGRADALLVPAPVVYDPGGPVCLLGDIDAAVIDDLCDGAAARGATIAVVQREGPPGEVPDTEPGLEAAGFHNPSEFLHGHPRSRSHT